jgi:hypothetical protein
MFVLLFLSITCPLALAQPGRPGRPGQPGQPFQPGQPIRPGQQGPSDADAAAAATACGGCGIAIVVIAVLVSLVTTVIWVFVLIWVAKDAKSRNVDNPALWVILVFFLGVIGLVIYVVARPQGELVRCRDCGNKRLRESRRCPHCRAV